MQLICAFLETQKFGASVGWACWCPGPELWWGQLPSPNLLQPSEEDQVPFSYEEALILTPARMIGRYMGSSLARKLSIAVVVPQGICIAMLVWYAVSSASEALEDQRRDRAEVVAGMLASSGARLVRSEDVSGLRELVRASLALKALRHSMFVKADGRVLAYTEPGLSGRNLATHGRASLQEGPPASRPIAQADVAIDVAAPVLDEGKLIGWARVSVSLADVRERQRAIMSRGIAFGAAAILLCLMIVLLAARSVTRRLENLAEASERFRSGDRNVRLQNTGNDEIAATGRGIGAMLETVSQAEKSLEHAHRVGQMGAWQFDPARQRLSLSNELYRMFGMDPAGPRPVFDEFLSPLSEDQKARIFRLADQGLQGETSSFSLPVDRPDGTRRIFRTDVRVDFNPDGAKLLVGICQDITEHEAAAAAQLREAGEIEAMGRAAAGAAGMAEDSNDLLPSTKADLDRLDAQIRPESPAKELVEETSGTTARASELTQQLPAVSSRQSPNLRSINLGRKVKGISGPDHRAGGKKIKAEVELAEDTFPTKANSAQVEIGALNPVSNARDAMRNGGDPTAKKSNCRIEEEGASDVTAGDHSALTVTDAGKKISPETTSQVSGSAASGKEAGRESRLGLGKVYDFVRQLGGHLRIPANSGHETNVKMDRPKDAKGEDPADDAGNTAPMPLAQNNEMVLLVEDDEGFRKLVDRQLSELGYKVICASGGAEALGYLDDGFRVDLLFTDIVMEGGIDGIELARQAVEKKPTLKVLHTSGFTSAATQGATGVKRLLSKPFRKQALAVAVREALDKAADEEVRG